MQHMEDIKIIFPCGMQLWQRNSKVVKVKVSNDRRLCGVDRDLARECWLLSLSWMTALHFDDMNVRTAYASFASVRHLR